MIEDVKRVAQLHAITAETLHCLQQVWPTVQPHAERILAEFFTHYIDEPAVAQIDSERRGALVAAQLAHWEIAFTANLCDEYLESTRRTTLAIMGARLPTYRLMTVANFCLQRFVVIIAAKHRIVRGRRERFINALTKMVIFDTDIAIFDYLACQQELERQRKREIEEAIMDFEDSVAPAAEAFLEASSMLSTIAAVLDNEAGVAIEKIGYANEVSGLIVKRIEKGAEVVKEVLTSMSEIGRQGVSTQNVAAEAVERNRTTSQTIADAVGKIGSIVGTISKIAAQTNLLALNARIEATRAGALGNGFAVIATEVKALAVQTSTATTEIAAQINAVEQATMLSVEDGELTCRTIGEIAAVGHAINAAVQEQEDATRRINRNISDAARFAQAVTTSIASMEAMNSHAKKGAGDLSGLAKSLMSHVGSLQADISSLRHRVLG